MELKYKSRGRDTGTNCNSNLKMDLSAAEAGYPIIKCSNVSPIVGASCRIDLITQTIGHAAPRHEVAFCIAEIT